MRPVDRLTIKCAYCGIEFQDYASNKRKYCSHACFTNNRIGTKASSTTKLKMSGKIPWNKGKHGVFSQKAIEGMSNGHIGKSPVNKGVPMSDEQKKLLGKILNGIKKPKVSESARKRCGALGANWKGGRTATNKIMRNREATRIWRKEIFTRDNYTCQLCFMRGGRLNAHHVFQVSKHSNLIWSLGNGITLHEECHKFFHQYRLSKMDYTANELYLQGII
jgi:hypothetical protein